MRNNLILLAENPAILPYFLSIEKTIDKEEDSMTKQKKPYVKPEFTITPAGSPKYKEILAALEAEGQVPQSQSKEAVKETNKKEVPNV